MIGAEASYRYNAVLRQGDRVHRVMVHPVPMLDPMNATGVPTEEGPDGCCFLAWWWDAAGMALIKAGPEWSGPADLLDFHDLHGESTYEWGVESGTIGHRSMRVVVPVVGGPPIAVEMVRSEEPFLGGTDLGVVDG